MKTAGRPDGRRIRSRRQHAAQARLRVSVMLRVRQMRFDGSKPPSRRTVLQLGRSSSQNISPCVTRSAGTTTVAM
jgi:hypothetical protein